MSEPEMRGYAAAQREYENRTPPDDGPSECPECDGKGHAPIPGDINGEIEQCSACHGFGLLDERGEPFDPNKAERDACDYADMKRDERRTANNDPQDWSEA